MDETTTSAKAITLPSHRIHIERPADLGRKVVFKGFPSLQEAFAFAAGTGVESRLVPISPLV